MSGTAKPKLMVVHSLSQMVCKKASFKKTSNSWPNDIWVDPAALTEDHILWRWLNWNFTWGRTGYRHTMWFSGHPYILDSDRFGFACNYGAPKSMFLHHCSHEMTSLGHAVEPISDTAPFSLKSIDPHVFHHFSGCIISDLSLYPTDLSTSLLMCSCWLLMSAIAWLNRV